MLWQLLESHFARLCLVHLHWKTLQIMVILLQLGLQVIIATWLMTSVRFVVNEPYEPLLALGGGPCLDSFHLLYHADIWKLQNCIIHIISWILQST